MVNRMRDPSIVANDSRRPCMKRSCSVGSSEFSMHQEIVSGFSRVSAVANRFTYSNGSITAMMRAAAPPGAAKNCAAILALPFIGVTSPHAQCSRQLLMPTMHALEWIPMNSKQSFYQDTTMLPNKRSENWVQPNAVVASCSVSETQSDERSAQTDHNQT